MPEDVSMLEEEPAEPTAGTWILGGDRAGWQVRLRWLVPPVVAIGVLGGRWLGYQLAVRPVLLVGVGILIYNALLHLALRQNRAALRQDPVAERRFNVVQVALDYVAILLLIHFTGGVTSPLLFFFVLHVIIAAILFRPGMAWLFAGLATLGVAGIGLAELGGRLAHYPLVYRGRAILVSSPPGYILAAMIFFAVSVLVTAALSTRVMERLRLEHERAYQAQQALMGERSRFMLQVAYHMRTPLAAALSEIDLVGQQSLGQISPQQRDQLGRASRRLRTLSDMVNELLVLARSRQRGVEADREPVDLAALVDQVARSFQSMAHRRGVTLQAAVTEPLPPLSGDREMLVQLVENLVSNAVKYSRPGGRVEVACSPRDREAVLLEVRDRGIGIPAAEKEQVFDEFFRASNARATEVTGTGLGLAIVKQVVNLHGGQIDFESQEGRGTTFRVELPVSA